MLSFASSFVSFRWFNRVNIKSPRPSDWGGHRITVCRLGFHLFFSLKIYIFFFFLTREAKGSGKGSKVQCKLKSFFFHPRWRQSRRGLCFGAIDLNRCKHPCLNQCRSVRFFLFWRTAPSVRSIQSIYICMLPAQIFASSALNAFIPWWAPVYFRFGFGCIWVHSIWCLLSDFLLFLLNVFYMLG